MSEIRVAALYVETGGVYYGLPDVDPWDEQRDARSYTGQWPVVAHPPCNRWSIMAQCRPELHERWGDDGGCFEHALSVVREFGGVLEHPALTRAWRHFGLPRAVQGGWSQNFTDPGFATEVDQGRYGARMRKMTWLYYVGPAPPALNWGDGGKRETTVRDIGNGRSSSTPPAFRDVLLNMARSAGRVHA